MLITQPILECHLNCLLCRLFLVPEKEREALTSDYTSCQGVHFSTGEFQSFSSQSGEAERALTAFGVFKHILAPKKSDI